MHTKTKGEIAEFIVSARLIELGWRVLFPAGENTRYDLVAERDGRFIRIQVKYVTPKDGALTVNCRSCNNWQVLPYTPEEIDVLAAYDAKHGTIYFIRSNQMNKNTFKLRLEKSKNHQIEGVHDAANFTCLSI